MAVTRHTGVMASAVFPVSGVPTWRCKKSVRLTSHRTSTTIHGKTPTTSAHRPSAGGTRKGRALVSAWNTIIKKTLRVLLNIQTNT